MAGRVKHGQRRFGRDLTVGSIPRHLVKFSVPLLLGNAIQVAYNIINRVWVGNLIGENAVGAVGVTMPIIFVTIGIAMGLTMATTILVSQYYGAKDHGMLKRVVDTSFGITLIIGAAFSIAGIVFGDHVLRMLGAPPENFVMASGYLKISFLSTIIIFLAFLINSILRGIGDTVTPMVFMAVGVGLNAALDPFFIGGWGPFPSHGLNGAAWASLVSQIVALIFVIRYLNKRDHMLALKMRKFVLDRHITFLIFKIGFPSIVQQSLVALGHMFISALVNSFGSAATNALGAVSPIDMVAFMPAMSISMGASALTGQNLGAKKPERVKDVFKWGTIISGSISVVISILVVIFAPVILKIFGLGKDLKAVEIGVSYLRIVGPAYVLTGVMFIVGGVINGSGHTVVTMIVSILGFWVMRVPLAWILSRTSLGTDGIWISIVASFVLATIISFVYYFSGRWKKAVIIKAPESLPIME
jgi:putative MATE family efflux protein